MTAHNVARDSVASCQIITLSPIDAWFFRDGRPYNAAESNQTDVVSLFPPPATTLVGAIRAGLARSKDWNGTSNWTSNPELAEVLGKDFEDLGKLSFCGPFLLREKSSQAELLYPMPLHVLGKTKKFNGGNEPIWQPQCLLTPDSETTCCDLGDIGLLVTSAVLATPFEKDGLKEPSSQWVTQAGLELILNGQLPQPAHVIESRDLWRHEVRVGLERCESTRTTKEGALYSPRFVRLKPGVSLVMSVTGLPDGWQVPTLLPLGGEGRLADCREFKPDAATDFSVPNGTLNVAVTLLTPLLPPDSEDKHSGRVAVPEPGQHFFGCENTTVVSACVGKPQTLGGWDSLNRRPLDLRPVIPAGSVWFIKVGDEISDPEALRNFIDRAKRGFGIKTTYGFGQVALGVWPEPTSSEGADS